MLSRLLFFLALLLSDIVTAWAAQTYEVTGVSANDVLNIRSTPRALARKVGEYGPRDKGIRIYRRDGNWALTGRIKPLGWVNGRFLKATTTTAQLQLPISCTGTEPFWSLTISSALRATYSDPETASRHYRVSGFERVGKGARLHLGGSGATLIKAGACSDGMSDKRYPHSLRLVLPDGGELRGCCG